MRMVSKGGTTVVGTVGLPQLTTRELDLIATAAEQSDGRPDAPENAVEVKCPCHGKNPSVCYRNGLLEFWCAVDDSTLHALIKVAPPPSETKP